MSIKVENLDDCSPHTVEYLGDCNPHRGIALELSRLAIQYRIGWDTLRSIFRPRSHEEVEGLKQLAFCLWKMYRKGKGDEKNEY